MQLPRASMANRFVTLEPIEARHREDFRAACEADTEIWERLYPISMVGEHFDPMWARLTEARDQGSSIPFAVVTQGRCRGITSYMQIDVPNRGVEVGGTYYAPDQRGGAVNPAAKRLMLGGAFEAGASRVQFRVDALNARSRAAVLKLGATQEGVFRQDRITWTGRVRDTVFFSILADEWPAVRDRLDARLAELS